MAFTGKIFDNSPSGKKLKRLRDESFKKGEKNNHNFGEYEVKDECVIYECIDCSMTAGVDFTSKKFFGSAIEFECPKRQWL